jgi:hypothetical protein
MHALTQRPQLETVEQKDQKSAGMQQFMGRLGERMKGWFKEF